VSFVKLVPFDRRLAGAVLAGDPGRLVGERELAAQTEAAYRRGVDDARAVADHQIVELRADLQRVGDGGLRQLAGVEAAMTAQLRDALPGLALEIARRLLAGFEPPPALIERVCEEALEQLLPEREGLELSLAPAEAELIGRLNPEWKRRYPGLRINADASLQPGDCLVRSRFGLTDARISTKLAALERGLTGA